MSGFRDRASAPEPYTGHYTSDRLVCVSGGTEKGRR